MLSRTVRITRKALRISSSCSAASSPGNSANHRTPGNTAQSAAAASHPVGVTQGTVCGCGSDAAGAALPGHPPGRSAYRFPAAAGFRSASICAIRRDTFSERLPKFIRRSLSSCACRWSISRSRLLSFSCRAWINASCSAGALFQQKDVVRRGVVHKPVFYRAYSATTRIKSATTWSGMSVTALAVASRYLPSASPVAPASGTLCHRGLRGRANRPRSSRFVSRHRPSPVDQSSFYLTAAASPEDEDVAGHRVIFQRGLHLCGEAIEAVAHIGDTGNQPDFCACGKIYHTGPRISSRRTVLMSSAEG